MTILAYVTTALIAYLLGAIPFGLIISRMRGIDIRKVGSGNIGATNVFRSVGKGWGMLTLVMDLLKGLLGTFVPFLVALVFTHWGQDVDATPELRLCGGLAAVLGHTWPVYLGFKGGKGVATSVGVLFGTAWMAAVAAVGVWVVVLLITRYVSLASILAALALGVAVWFQPLRPATGAYVPAVFSLIALLVVVRHRSNIARLASGNENRFSWRKK